MDQKNGKVISISLILSLLGILLLIGGTAIGLYLLGESPLVVVGLTGAVAIVAPVSLYFAVRAKSPSFPGRGLIRLCSIIGMAGSIFVATMPTIYTTNYIREQRMLAEAAANDLAAIHQMWNGFKDAERSRVALTVQGLANFVHSDSRTCSPSLQEWLARMGSSPLNVGQATVTLFTEQWNHCIDNVSVGDIAMAPEFELRLASMQAGVQSGLPWQMASVANSLAPTANQMAECFTARSAALNLPRIQAAGNQLYSATDNIPNTYRAPDLTLPGLYAGIFRFSWAGAVVMAVVLLLYFMVLLSAPGDNRPSVATGPKASDRFGTPI